jgi:hypothetical protein
MAKASGEGALLELVRAIAAHDGKKVARLLKASPALATEASGVGATRQEAKAYFLEEIPHYIYEGDTALHLAAAAHDRAAAEALLARGASVSACNRRGAQPLHYAVDGNPQSPSWDPDAQVAVIHCLLEAGADPGATDKNGVTPLHRAVRTRCAAAVRTLLEGGANPRGKNGNGSTPLHLAVQNTGRGGSGGEGARAQQKEIIRLLLAHGARPSDRDAAGKSVRQSVIGAGILEVLDGG